jgi:hypothetical protein
MNTVAASALQSYIVLWQRHLFGPLKKIHEDTADCRPPVAVEEEEHTRIFPLGIYALQRWKNAAD